jgi:hypothetical protein
LQLSGAGRTVWLVSSVAFPSRTAPRPGFFRVLWELIVGFVFALFALAVPVVGLAVLGIFDWNARSSDWPLKGPFVPVGAWAISADLFCAAVVVGVSSVIVGGSMSAGLGLPVSRLVVALVVTLTGVAPFLDAQVLPVMGPAVLLVAAFLIRVFAVDRSEPSPIHFSRRMVLAASAACAVGLALTVSFGVTHPLWPNSVNVIDQRVSFRLRNAGFADVTIVRMSEPAQTGFPATWRRTPVEGLVVPARGSRWITLVKRGCPPKDLSVRYRILGRVMSAPVRPVPPPLNMRC